MIAVDAHTAHIYIHTHKRNYQVCIHNSGILKRISWFKSMELEILQPIMEYTI